MSNELLFQADERVWEVRLSVPSIRYHAVLLFPRNETSIERRPSVGLFVWRKETRGNVYSVLGEMRRATSASTVFVSAQTVLDSRPATGSRGCLQVLLYCALRLRPDGRHHM